MPLTLDGEAMAGPKGHPTVYTLRDFIIVAFYHQRIIVSVLAISFVLAALAWLTGTVRYTATSQLLVLTEHGAPAGPALGDLASLLSMDSGGATQSEVEFIRDRAVVRGMVERVGAATLNPRLGQRRLLGLLSPATDKEQIEAATDFAESWLGVVAQPESNHITVSFQHTDRAVALRVVDTLIDVYLQRRAAIFANLHSPFLKEKAKSYAQQLSQIEDQIQAEQTKFHVLDLPQEILLAVNEVDATGQRRQRQIEQREATIAEIAATERDIAALPKEVFDFTETGNHEENDQTQELLAKLYLQRDTLRAHYQPGNGQIDDIQRQIDVLEKMKSDPKAQPPTTREVRNPTLDVMNNHLSQLRTTLESLKESVAELDRQTDQAKQRVDDLREAGRTLAGLQRSQAIMDKLYRETEQQAETAQTEEASSAAKTANIQILDRADASLKGSSRRNNLFLAVMVGGCMAAGALTLVAAWNRRNYLLPQEVTRSLNIPVLATFTEETGFDGADAQAQIIYLAGQFVFARTQTGHTGKLQVISSGDDELRPDFAMALAVELAHGQAQRTLLLDLAGDGTTHWRQLAEEVPEFDTDSGLSIAATSIEKLHISVGAPTGEVNWLRANGEAFRLLFDKLSRDYDIIVIDAPAARDSLVGLRLANVVDGSIVVVRAEHTRAPVAEHLCDQLLGTGGNLFGAIITDRKFHIPRAIYRWF